MKDAQKEEDKAWESKLDILFIVKKKLQKLKRDVNNIFLH